MYAMEGPQTLDVAIRDVKDVPETEGVMGLKLEESFKLLVEKTVKSCDFAKVQNCFSGHTSEQQILACYKFNEMTQLFVEAAMDEFKDLCAEKKMYESLDRFRKLCQLQGVEERNGRLVATRQQPSIVEPDQVALEQRLFAKKVEIERLTELLNQIKKEKLSMKSQLSQKQADADEVLKLFPSEAAKLQGALPSRRLTLHQRRDGRRISYLPKTPA